VDYQNLLIEWHGLQGKLKEVKDREMAVRKQLFDHYFKNPKVGVNRYELTGGYQLEGKYALSYSMDFDKFRKVCDSEEALDVGLVFEDVVDYKPVFNATTYKYLADEMRVVIDEALTIKPAAPTLKLRR
jgi:hypothetical protein